MKRTRYYYKGERVEILDLFEGENGRLVAIVEYVDEYLDDEVGVFYAYLDKIEERFIA